MVWKGLMCSLTLFLAAYEIFFYWRFISYFRALVCASCWACKRHLKSQVFKSSCTPWLWYQSVPSVWVQLCHSSLWTWRITVTLSIFIPHPPEMIENVCHLFFSEWCTSNCPSCSLLVLLPCPVVMEMDPSKGIHLGWLLKGNQHWLRLCWPFKSSVSKCMIWYCE